MELSSAGVARHEDPTVGGADFASLRQRRSHEGRSERPAPFGASRSEVTCDVLERLFDWSSLWKHFHVAEHFELTGHGIHEMGPNQTDHQIATRLGKLHDFNAVSDTEREQGGGSSKT